MNTSRGGATTVGVDGGSFVTPVVDLLVVLRLLVLMVVVC